MGMNVVGSGSPTLRAKASAWWEKWKIWIAVAVLVALALCMWLFNNSVLTWVSAIVAAALTILKEILSTIGSAVETESQEAHDVTLADASATTVERTRVIADLRAKTSLKRSWDVWASTCGMFAAVFGVPAVVRLVADVYPF